MQTQHPEYNHRTHHLTTIIFSTLVILAIIAGAGGSTLAPIQPAQAMSSMLVPADVPAWSFYLPTLSKGFPWNNLFGVEASSSFYPDNFLTNYATELQAGYARLNERISWRTLQPEEGDPIDWALLADFETELRTLRAANIDPIVIVDDYPRWATDNTVRIDGQPTACGPLLPERYADFAIFMQALVSRYSVNEFNVHIWELGNEPDIDPNLVTLDSHYGCWGDWDKVTYNGDAYGQMLITVTPAIKVIDPSAQVWIGGLLLDRPFSSDPNHVGRPELFLQGILESGAAPYFDVVSYHAYLQWNGLRVDQDIYSGSSWDALGGVFNGKADFLRSILNAYGVDKPLVVTETSLLCGWCEQAELTYPGTLATFYDLQADLAARSFPRAMANDISGLVWYTLDGPGWRLGGLLDQYQLPKMAYNAYYTFMGMIYGTSFSGPVDYGAGIEAYSYNDGAERIDIAFAIDDSSYSILLPQQEFIAAFDRFGAPISPEIADLNYLLTIQFEPIYIIRTR